MWRKIFAFLCGCGLLFSAACKARTDIISLSENEVYFFYQESCPHCHHAADYIKENHPELPVKSLDVRMPGNMRLFEEAVKTYKISGSIGTPLICFGENYIMGWGSDDPKRLDGYAEKYEK